RALVEGHQLWTAIEDDLVAAKLRGLAGRMFYQQEADAPMLVIPVDRDVFDVPHAAALVDKLLFDQEAESANNAIARQCDISPNASAEPAPEYFRGLCDRQFYFPESGQRFQEVSVDMMPCQLADHDIHGVIPLRARLTGIRQG